MQQTRHPKRAICSLNAATPGRQLGRLPVKSPMDMLEEAPINWITQFRKRGYEIQPHG